jgi:hypothetical protein
MSGLVSWLLRIGEGAAIAASSLLAAVILADAARHLINAAGW